MKVGPQKRKEFSYPKMTDAMGVCKTAAALTITATTLFAMTGCDSTKNPGLLIKNKIKNKIKTDETLELSGDVEIAPPDDLGYAGGESYWLPSEAQIDSKGTVLSIEEMRSSQNTEYSIDGGSVILTIEKDTDYILCSNPDLYVRLSDVEDDCELHNLFNPDNYDYYEISGGGGLIIIAKNCSTCYVEDVVIMGDFVMEIEED